MGSKRAILKCNNGVPAISFPPQEENQAKSCSPENTAVKGWQIRALSETEMQLQVLCLTKPFFLLLFPTFSFLLLNSAGKLAWGEPVLDFGHVPSGLRAIAFRSQAEWSIKQMTKKEENSPP